MLSRLFTVFLLGFTLFAFSGCASTEPEKKKPVNPDKDKVSTIPWNKPASWEGQGQMGGLGGAFGGH